jgi:aspartate/methionine/tyrosine aminotransferase
MVSKRTADMTSFIVMDVLEKAVEMEKQGHHIVHLEVGEPDFDTPDCIKTAVCKALEDGYTHYTHSMGLIELREAISRYYQDTYGVAVDPNRVIVTSGTSPAMFLLFSALLEAGDEVIVSDPHYACYPNFIRFAQATPVMVPVFESDGFQYRPQDIRQQISEKTRGILINSPANPTGTLLSSGRLKSVAEIAAQHQCHVISDEIYHGLVYEGSAHSILEFTDRAFVLNGFSKLYAMTGLRLGYLIAPEEFIRPMQKLHQNFFISASGILQKAGITALTEATEEIERMKRTYNERRIYMVKRLKALGLGITVEPTGAFYVFANARHITRDSYKLAFDILKKAHVGVAPGIDFGPHGEGYLRFCYANSMENIRAGLDRLERYLAS